MQNCVGQDENQFSMTKLHKASDQVQAVQVCKVFVFTMHIPKSITRPSGCHYWIMYHTRADPGYFEGGGGSQIHALPKSASRSRGTCAMQRSIFFSVIFTYMYQEELS